MAKMKTEKDKAQQGSSTDDFSFLDGLPEVKKKTKPDLFADHLSFLSSLEIPEVKKSNAPVKEESVSAPPVVEAKKPEARLETKPSVKAVKVVKKSESKTIPAKPPQKKSAPKPKKKSNVQLQREEKNRLEQERAVAKKVERLARQKVATATAAVAEEKQAPEPTPVNKSLIGKALSFIKPKPAAK